MCVSSLHDFKNSVCQVILIFPNNQVCARLHGYSWWIMFNFSLNCSINSSQQYTPLHRVAHGRNVDTVRCFVNKGAYDHIEDDDSVSEWEYTADCLLIKVWLASFQAFPVFDRSQYAKMEGEGLVNLTTRSTTQLMSQFLDRGIHLYQQLATEKLVKRGKLQ